MQYLTKTFLTRKVRGLFHRLFAHESLELDYHEAVGGHWDDIGRIQFEFLLKEGLKPNHRLLDVACGSFRGGRYFIEYLEGDRYFGIDKNTSLLDAGREQILRPLNLLAKRPSIYNVELCAEPIDLFGILGTRFDYIWIHALFDHIPPEVIRFCLRNLTEVMVSSGRLYATIFLNPHGPDFMEPMIRPRYGSLHGAIVTFPDCEYWHHTLEFFEDVAGDISELRLDRCIYDYPHPFGLRVLRFIRQ